MKKAIALIMAALFCLTCIAYADDAARRQLQSKFTTLMETV